MNNIHLPAVFRLQMSLQISLEKLAHYLQTEKKKINNGNDQWNEENYFILQNYIIICRRKTHQDLDFPPSLSAAVWWLAQALLDTL